MMNPKDLPQIHPRKFLKTKNDKPVKIEKCQENPISYKKYPSEGSPGKRDQRIFQRRTKKHIVDLQLLAKDTAYLIGIPKRRTARIR